ncbi:N-acetylmuramoyl-L-alanine amidase family protein [Emergencia timonensis]|uniref:N-acetylmuramoyl-L-alanine amidase family protein n=1 Tax=Emergencia timonensis TaxID=1776384 RepID=UPI0039F5B9FA
MPKKVYFDAGHGGSDPGAVKYVKEAEVAIKVVKAACKYLKDNYTCEVHQDITPDSTHTIAARANKWKADLFVSVHFNAGGGDGYECFLFDKSNLKLGQCFEKRVKEAGQNSRGVKYDPTLNVLRLTNMKAILNEIAFVDNKKDIRDWDEDSELKVMGNALAKAAADWLNLPKKKKLSVNSKKTLKVGSKVKIKSGAEDLNTKKAYSDFVYKTTYTVISISGDRVVFGLNGKITGATSKSNITLA